MENRSCCGFGHRDVLENIEQSLTEKIKVLIDNEKVSVFYVGDNGEFDKLFSSAVRRLKITRQHIKLYLVKPYFSNTLNKNKSHYERLYDDVIIPQELMGRHFKSAITKRNMWMINNSNFVLGYIKRDFGGAFDAIAYAKKCGKMVIDI